MFSTQASQTRRTASANVALIALGTWLVLGNRITLGTMMMFFPFRAFPGRAPEPRRRLRDGAAPRPTNAERIEDVMADEARYGA